MIYLDNAATTPVKPEVVDAMLPYFTDKFGNPSAVYSAAEEPKKMIEYSRNIIANELNCHPEEIYFTSGGTESDNWAIKGVCDANDIIRIVTSQIEHHAVLNTCEYMETKGIDVHYIGVNKVGEVNLTELENALVDDRTLVSIMMSNNEIGTIQHIESISKIVHRHNCILHVDAVQAFKHMSIDVEKYGIDLLSASSHKFNGPKGVGFLYKKNGIEIEPLLHGGGQENGLRSGTENVPGIVGMGAACEIPMVNLLPMRDYLINGIISLDDKIHLNGAPVRRLMNNINVTLPIHSLELVTLLDTLAGIEVSAGSACASNTGELSHVLKAIGLSDEEMERTIRITISDETTKEQCDNVIKIIDYAIKERENE